MAEVKKYFGSIKNDYSHPDSTPSLTKNPEFIPGAIIKLEVEEPFSNSVQIRVNWLNLSRDATLWC